MNNKLIATYTRLPVTFERGEGVWLWDNQGHQYLDAISGIAVCNLGHAHPAVTQAIREQAGKLIHTSNLYGISEQSELATRLCGIAAMDAAFFCNSGAEANEAAIKLARLFGHQNGRRKPAIVVMENSFHGRTLATLTATGNRKVQAGFEPLVQGFIRVPFNDIGALETIALNNEDVVAVLVEPIQGEGGVQIPDAGYLSAIRRICDQHHWLMMLDEVQTGMGRTGQWFSHQHEGAVPDVMTLAKGLGNGMPIGACLAKGRAAEVFAPGNHGSTFGGNPLASHTARAVIDVIEREQLCARAAALGTHIVDSFSQRLTGIPNVKAIRGQGLLIGIELDQPCSELVNQALARRLLINVTAANVIRLLPPLVLTKEQADAIVEGVCDLIIEFLGARKAS